MSTDTLYVRMALFWFNLILSRYCMAVRCCRHSPHGKGRPLTADLANILAQSEYPTPCGAFCLIFRPVTPFMYAMWTRRAVIGEFDEIADASKDLSRVRADPLKPVTH